MTTETNAPATTPLQAELLKLVNMKQETLAAYRAADAKVDHAKWLKAIDAWQSAQVALGLQNQRINEAFAALVQVGDPVTRCGYSDYHAGLVISVSISGLGAAARTKLVMQECNARLLNGPNSGEPDALNFAPGGFCGHTSGTQRWEITPDQNGRMHTFTLRKDGHWQEAGVRNGKPLIAGHHHHYDFNF